MSDPTPIRWGARALTLLACVSLAVVAVLANVAPASAIAWRDPVEVSGSGRAFANPGALARAGNTTGIAYIEATASGSSVYLKRSTNGGATWGHRKLISGTTGQALSVSMAARGTSFFIVWTQLVGGTARVHYARSQTLGDSWTKSRLSPANENAYDPRVAVDGRGRVAVVWAGGPLGGPQTIWSKVATNGGVTFGGRVAVATPFAVSSAKPSVAIGSSVNIHVAYNGNDAILYQRSSDGGASWSPAQALAAGVDTSVSPGLAVAATDVFVGYTRVSGGDSWVQFRESENDGNSWAAARQLAPKSANNTGFVVLDARGHYIRAVFSRCLTNPCADDAIATVVRVDCCTLGARWGPPRRVSPTSHDRAIPIGVTGSQANVFGEQKTIVAWYRQDSGGAILQVWTRRDL